MLTIIGLIGAKGAGKTTVSGLLAGRTTLPVKEGALADKLKDVCSQILDIDRDAFDYPSLKERYLYPTGVIELNRNIVAMLLDEFRLPITDANIDRHVGKNLYTPRQVAQYVGTEILRSVDPDVHCKGLMQDAPKEGVLIVSDIRFPNELEFFNRYSRFGDVRFYSIYVQNDAAEVKAKGDTHETESHLPYLSDKADFVVENNSTLEDLAAKLASLATIIFPTSGSTL